MTWHRSTWLWILVFVGFALFVFVLSRSVSENQRLFYEWQETDFGRPGLFMIRPVVDRHGNWLFFDRNLNYLILVITNDPSRLSGFSELGENSGVLFQGAPYETPVHGKHNVLEIAVTATHRELFDIECGDAERIYRTIQSSESGASVIDDLLQSYRGSEAKRLEVLLGGLRGSQMNDQSRPKPGDSDP